MSYLFELIIITTYDNLQMSLTFTFLAYKTLASVQIHHMKLILLSLTLKFYTYEYLKFKVYRRMFHTVPIELNCRSPFKSKLTFAYYE